MASQESAAEAAERPRDQVSVSLTQKILLNALLGTCEASFTFEQLYTASVLQGMGLPLRLVYVVGAVSGPSATLLISLFGGWCDRGDKPRRRKLLALLVCAAILLAGMACVLVAQVVHVARAAASPAFPLVNMSAVRQNGCSSDATAPSSCLSPTPPPSVPVHVWLAVAGFILLDCGFDVTNCFARSWTLSSCPLHQHPSLLKVGVAVCATLAAVPALLATADLEALLGLQWLDGMGETLAQGCVIMAMVVLGTVLAATTGLRLQQSPAVCTHDDTHSSAAHDMDSVQDRRRVSDSSLGYSSDDSTDTDTRHAAYSSGRDDSGDDAASTDDRRQLLGTGEGRTTQSTNSSHSQSVILCGGYTRVEPCHHDCDSEDIPCMLSQGCGKNYQATEASTVEACSDHRASSNDGQLERAFLHSPCFKVQRFLSHLRSQVASQTHGLTWAVAAVCLGSYFSTGAILLFDFMAPDFVGKDVYSGRPSETAGTPEAQAYQKGIQMSAWSLMIYNGTFLLYSLVQYRVLDVCGYKMEFVIALLALGGGFILLAVTSRVELFFVLSAAAGMRRASICVVPFKLINDTMHKQVDTASDDSSGSHVGRAMSLVAVTMPFAMCTLYPWVGAVEESTGWVALPMYVGAIYAGLAAAVSLSIPQAGHERR